MASHFRHSLEGAKPPEGATPAEAPSDFAVKDSEASSKSRSSKWSDVVSKKSSNGSSSWALKRSDSKITGVSTDNLERLTTIQNVEILKGIPLCLALGNFGWLFGVGGDPLAHMAMSRRVVELQDFISHNWVIPRYTKWATLALHYNVWPACVATLVVCAWVSLLVALGILPPLGSDEEYARVNWNKWIGNLTFFSVVLFWQDMKRNLPSSLQVKERMTFVDKSCIHQTDKAKMIEGISNLAGFLRSSDYMIVCCGPQYFRKLWTVYEIASFLTIHRDPSHIKIYPTTWAKTLAILAIANWFLASTHGLAAHAGQVMGLPLALIALSEEVERFVMNLIFVYCIRRSVLAQDVIRKDLSTFDIRNAHCAVESDRPVVEANVSVFMRELGRVPQHVQQEEALDAFNHMVHTDFLSYMAGVRASLTFMFMFQGAVSLPRVLGIFDISLEWGLFYNDPITAAAWLVNSFDYLYLLVLLGNLIAVPLASRNLELSVCCKHTYLFGISFFVYLAQTAAKVPISFAVAKAFQPEEPAATRLISLAGTALLQAVLFGITLFSGRRPCCHKRHETQFADVRPGITVNV